MGLLQAMGRWHRLCAFPSSLFLLLLLLAPSRAYLVAHVCDDSPASRLSLVETTPGGCLMDEKQAWRQMLGSTTSKKEAKAGCSVWQSGAQAFHLCVASVSP
eukprot:1158780-Pelagomonas_calceolata.AAC.3